MGARNFIVMTTMLINLVLTTYLVTAMSHKSLPPELLALNVSDKLRTDPNSIKLASTDYGHIVTQPPAAVLYPTSLNDVVALVRLAYRFGPSAPPLRVAAAGRRHSVRGQAMAPGGVVVNMTSLACNSRNGGGAGVVVSGDDRSGYYADVGGEEIFFDVLGATLRRGLAPVTWTDYLYVTVGGALSNAGIGGETFRYGPEISNVLELDVITGKGELVTCSKDNNPELFFSVLGGLGQFGIITRARIVLAKAPSNVKWVRLLYTDFSTFSRDQETLISENGNYKAVSYLEGQLLLSSAPSIWNSSFYSIPDQTRITNLVNNHSIIYCIELALFHDAATPVDQELRDLLGMLSFVPGFVFERDVSYTDFLNRVHSEELVLRALGLWEVPHPWLNLFVPASRMLDFDSGVFKDIVVNGNITAGVVLVYPMNRDKWDDRMSVVIPEEEVFYTVGFLHATPNNDWESLDAQNDRILKFCESVGIKVNQYLSHHETQQDWAKHFGAKWARIQQRKAEFDPKNILSPGQRIFN